MDDNDRTGPHQWSTTSPEHLDRLARGVLGAARDAARELRRNPPVPARQTWALGKLAGQTQAMLGPDMPSHPPIGAAAQEGFVRTALALAVHVRAHSWAKADLGAPGVPGRDDVPHPGEIRTADAFDVLGRLVLPHASPEGWTATLVTDLARGDKTLEAAVKLGKYILHPTFLALTDDTTRVIGEALHGLNVRHLRKLTHSLRHYACTAGPSHPTAAPEPATPPPLPPRNTHMSTTPLREPSRRKSRLSRVPEGPTTTGSAPGPAGPQSPAPLDPPRNPPAPGPSEPGSPGLPGPHGF
ncbi:hypothetical protein [Streptomyces sp. NBC_00258]|uniref:hypothetical protein n=1 Tax=Streptomyces sp. NBC_00258 TaxID=2903642 RepID=UPI002E2CDCAE|nr:hypothetical protein [Streptomyces sp. NBC_00258]